MIRFWQKIYAKNDNVKAYSLLLPALILVTTVKSIGDAIAKITKISAGKSKE
jgi:hypothetical protein